MLFVLFSFFPEIHYENNPRICASVILNNSIKIWLIVCILGFTAKPPSSKNRKIYKYPGYSAGNTSFLNDKIAKVNESDQSRKNKKMWLLFKKTVVLVKTKIYLQPLI